MNREQLCMLKELMAVQFTALELHLYLDTHPTDQKALMEYNSVVQQLNVLKHEYQQRYGPLTWGEPSAYPWQWINEPWPWEICYE
ncbi:MAG: spore coat protein CotJB [Firmicutes bacterium]|nr:spore coat protein CotJB [Bacillota bacterium]